MRDAFRHSKERRIAMFGGMAIMVAITILSCVSSYTIYVDGFRDMPYAAQQALALFAVVVVEGTFIWLLFSIGRAFSSSLERFFAVLGLVFIVGVMALNVVTHFMQAKLIPLHRYQTEWVNWGAVLVVIAILVLVLFIQLADPVARLIRLELRYMGRQEETILAAKSEALDSERIQTAMANRADAEAEKLAQRIEGEAVFPSQLDAGAKYGNSRREMLEIPAQKKDTAKTHVSFDSEGLKVSPSRPIWTPSSYPLASWEKKPTSARRWPSATCSSQSTAMRA